MEIKFTGSLHEKVRNPEDRIRQGDYVFCRANSGACSFWGIYSETLKTIVALDGAGSSYIQGDELYLGDTYKYWTIVKRISVGEIRLTIEEIE